MITISEKRFQISDKTKNSGELNYFRIFIEPQAELLAFNAAYGIFKFL